MLTLLLTRPAAQSARCAAAFSARHPGIPVVVAPVIDIRPRPYALPETGTLIVTSRHALPGLPAAAQGRGVWCVGEATAAAARAAGLRPEGWAEDAAGLVAAMILRRPAGPFVHLAGDHRAADLAGLLTAAGLPTRTVVVYDQPARPLTLPAQALLSGAGPVLLPLFSPRSARLVGAAPCVTAPLRIAAMSAAVAAAWPGPAPQRLQIAAHPTSEAMLHALGELTKPGGAA